MGSYDGLRVYLAGRDERHVELSFEALEGILGRKLPASAHNHRAWWANDRSHSHAHAWLEAGWEVDRVNLTARKVSFRR
jgi:hypothetical protein